MILTFLITLMVPGGGGGGGGDDDRDPDYQGQSESSENDCKQ